MTRQSQSHLLSTGHQGSTQKKIQLVELLFWELVIWNEKRRTKKITRKGTMEKYPERLFYLISLDSSQELLYNRNTNIKKKNRRKAVF